MKSTIRRIAAFAVATSTVALGTVATIAPVTASQFGQKEVDQNKFVAVASPFQGGNSHQLLIIEQVANSRPCWSEFGSTPTQINPLLTTFDFTGVCGRSTDSNGYSIRINGEDLGLQYSLRVVRRDGDMLLLGAPRDRSRPELLIGQTNGITSEFAKINLVDGWRFTKRTFGDTTLGHVYLTYEGANPPIARPGSSTGNTGNPGIPAPVTPGNTGTLIPRFRDTANDIYLAEINEAVELGFIAGFSEDNTFRPQATLTREQLVSMVLEALNRIPNANLNIPAQTSTRPYSDVEPSRWSAAKIQFARQNNIISGYQDGTFRPSQPVTRAELMAVLRRAAEFGRTLRGQQAQLPSNRPATNFSDINNHWANDLVNQMSTFCGVASPVNERGSAFAPDSASQRNYAAAATLRMLNCVRGDSQTAQQGS